MRICAMAVVAVLLSGCGRVPASLVELNASFDNALESTAPLAATHLPGSDMERIAFERLERYFAGMTPATVRAQTADVYARDAYLNDTLVGISGARRIEEYFAHTASQAREMRVEFLQRAPAGPDWYVRWRMTVVVDALNDGQPVVTYGVTQFRFDEDGRVLLHKDYWDAGTGLYEHLPVVGGLIQRVRARLGAAAEP